MGISFRRWTTKLKSRVPRLPAPYNVRVDAAARIKAPSAAPSKLREALPPLASNEVIYLETLRKKGSPLLKFAADYRP